MDPVRAHETGPRFYAAAKQLMVVLGSEGMESKWHSPDAEALVKYCCRSTLLHQIAAPCHIR